MDQIIQLWLGKEAAGGDRVSPKTQLLLSEVCSHLGHRWGGVGWINLNCHMCHIYQCMCFFLIDLKNKLLFFRHPNKALT